MVELLEFGSLVAGKEDPTDLAPYRAAFQDVARQPGGVVVVEVGGEVVPVHCDTFAGFIFVNFAPEPSQSLREFLGPMLLGIEDYPFGEMTDRYSFKVECRSKHLEPVSTRRRAGGENHDIRRQLGDHVRFHAELVHRGEAIHLFLTDRFRSRLQALIRPPRRFPIFFPPRPRCTRWRECTATLSL